MVIKISTGEDWYWNSQIWFAKNIIPNLPNDDHVWALEYQKWLQEQGAELVLSHSGLIRNSIGVAPGYDHIEFADEQKHLIFVLRWS